ncbi:hypothetical protein I305_01456 [Cryptococcus gattii E566]|uniref:Uncharacterized protein n=1 Tax=Cryptococcus gattii serotype B (strain WM276 / ATCC MYA-4071) TaxID=367775 RepID=E6R9I8_CRYGW|nr:Hypothetical Protein CGB_G3600C [Cryptococcus gattii WM276]ADV23460.1 Hypothetical Protein CGB_G3600C [Cryptococcus gattii WM276]KIY35881.1 hypothetical protein I305_01456 [Cryptococcus gattii E566]
MLAIRLRTSILRPYSLQIPHIKKAPINQPRLDLLSEYQEYDIDEATKLKAASMQGRGERKGAGGTRQQSTHNHNLTCQANRPKKTASISSTTFSRMIKPVKAAPKLRFWSQNLQPALMQDNSFDRIGLELIGGVLHANVGIAILEVPYLMKTDEM